MVSTLCTCTKSLTVFGAYALAIVRSLGIPAVGTDLGGGTNPLMLDRRGIELLDGVVSISRYAHDLIANFYSGKHEVLVGTSRHRALLPCQRDRVRKRIAPSWHRPPHGALRRPHHAAQGYRIGHRPRSLLICAWSSPDASTTSRTMRCCVAWRQARTCTLFMTQTMTPLSPIARRPVCPSLNGPRRVRQRPAKPELMGLTTLEAMSCGLAVAVADTGVAAGTRSGPEFGAQSLLDTTSCPRS